MDPNHNASTIVGIDERGHQYSYSSISAAINDVPPNWLIYIPPGTYYESIILTKPVEIIGDGPRDQIIIESSDADCIMMQTSTAIVRHLTLRCSAGLKHKRFYAVDIPQGQLKLTDCDITSDSLPCIGIHNASANPLIQQCVIHDSKQAGIYVYEHGQGIIEDCDIFGNALAGIDIKQHGNLTVRRCKIHHDKECGVFIYENGQGIIEDCDIFGNALAGIAVREGGNPHIMRCRIYDGKASGIFVYENGQGVIEDCAIFGNAYAGAEIKEGGNPRLMRCRINRNGYKALWAHDKGLGVVENCDLTGNARGLWDISLDSVVLMSGNKT